MDPARLSSDDLRFLEFHWNLAIQKQTPFFPGTAWFSSEFFAKLRGQCSHNTMDAHFERLGLEPLKDKKGEPIKEGQFFFWNLFDLQKL